MNDSLDILEHLSSSASSQQEQSFVARVKAELAKIAPPRKRKMGDNAHDHFCTPPEVTEPMAEYFCGPVAGDPCSNPKSIVKAREVYYQGALWLPWRQWRNWYENPPYSNLEPFTEKGVREYMAKGSKTIEAVRLVPVATSTCWWRKAMGAEPVFDDDGKPVTMDRPRVLFLKRIAFIDPRAKKDAKRESARFDPALIYYGPRADKFARHFKHITSWSTR